MERSDRRTVLVTGATDGIGREAALALGMRGWKVLVHGRSAAKVDSVVAQLRREAESGSIEGVVADFAVLESVHALADTVSRSRLDALVNNVGIGAFHGERSADGHELTFAVGHLAPFALTMWLLPTLLRAPRAAIVHVASQSHRAARLTPHDVVAQLPESANAAYARTKLSNLVVAFELARRCQGTALQSVAYDPGPTMTPLMQELMRETKGLQRFFVRALVPLLANSAARAGASLAWVTERGLEDGAQGAYFGIRRKPLSASARARDPQRAKALFDASERLTGSRFPPRANTGPPNP